jgi:hypothetical protein
MLTGEEPTWDTVGMVVPLDGGTSAITRSFQLPESAVA